MELPDFDEFLASIDVDELKKKNARVVLPHVLQFSMGDPQAIRNALAIIYQDAVQNSVSYMKVYLAEYHAWLSKQL